MSESQINAHYGRTGLGEAILDWLRARDNNLDALTIQDLAPADQYHAGGLPSTIELAELARVSGEMRVADLGGGIGGSARYLAVTYGCHVDVIDFTEEFCRAGELLTAQMRLSDKVSFSCASATNTGLPSETYDLVWMHNVAMNIEDRPALYAEVRRLLKPRGRYVFREAMAGDSGPAYYPTQWATTQDQSFLHSPESVMRMLLDGGFRALFWADETGSSIRVRAADSAARVGTIDVGPPPVHYLSPENLRLAAANGTRNSDEGRLRGGRGLFQKL